MNYMLRDGGQTFLKNIKMSEITIIYRQLKKTI